MLYSIHPSPNIYYPLAYFYIKEQQIFRDGESTLKESTLKGHSYENAGIMWLVLSLLIDLSLPWESYQ
jgi:hypothetical protein